MKKIGIAFSPCPNDTFIFYAMIHSLVDTKDFYFKPHISDIEDLNRDAYMGRFEVTKLSIYAYLLLRNRYIILNSGAALGSGCGPIIIAREKPKKIENITIAIPGENTTANLLLKLWNPKIINTTVTRFDNIIDGVRDGVYDAGLVIHEGRFIYSSYNLIKIIDLGDWWERETGCPIPLGCITLRKDYGNEEIIEDINSIIRSSVEYSIHNRSASREFIKSYAQEMDDRIIDEHIRLYVNKYTIDLGEDGEKAIKILEDMAKCKKII